MISALLLGAGAGVACAFPHPQQWGQSWANRGHKHYFPGFPNYSNGGSDVPSSFPSLPPGSAASGIMPSGYAGTTGTAAPSCGVSYVTVGASSAAPYPTSVPIEASSSDLVSPVTASSAVSAVPYSTPASSSVANAVSTSSISSAVAYSASGSSAAGSSSVYAAVGSSAAASAAPVASASAGTTAVTADSGCTFTDADAAADGKGDCSTIVLSDITVPAGETLDLSDLNDGTTVQFQGTTTFEYDEWEGPLIRFSGTGITITGADGHVIDGNGEAWWDGEGSNGGVTKPKFFYAHDLTDSTIKGLNIKNTPVQAFSVDDAQNLKIQDVTIDNTDGDVEDGGHNTDCFDIGSSTGVYLSGITCKNQDDCIAINSGTDIQFTGGTCSGGHGLSIGSVGGRDDNDVQDIYIADSTISDSDNGVRIKCNSGTTGSVSNVTYSGITLSGINDYGIVIEQDYENGGPTGEPTDGVPITGLTLKDITGSVGDDAQAYYILCAACSDWTVSGVDVTGGSQEETCAGEPSGVDLC